MTKLYFSLCISVAFLAFSLQALTTKELMKADLTTITHILDLQYAPAEWKRSFSGWEPYHELQKAKDKIDALEKITLKDYRKIVRDFFRSAKDYHLGVEFYSTEYASLPFRVKGAEGKYFITNIDRQKLSASVFPWKIGDELIAFDGYPIQQIIDQLKAKDVGISNEGTDNALAEMFLTFREASFGHSVPQGPLMVTLKSGKNGVRSSYQLIWDYTPEKIPEGLILSDNPVIASIAHLQAAPHYVPPESPFDFLMVAPIYQYLANLKGRHPDTDHDLGLKESFIPPLGKIEWETDSENPFRAYLCKTPDGVSLGYIRIHEYVGKEPEAKAFGEIINTLQEKSDALVIDQVNNPGGSVFFMYALASMLTDQPLYTPKHRSSITPHEIAVAFELIPLLESAASDEDAEKVLGTSFSGIPVTLQMVKFMLNYFRFIIDEWAAGRTLTNPFYLYGIDCINPHPTFRYTKPILILINSMDFSGADFFPAIFQDNKRATIFGSRTAGAGGHVTSAKFPNRFGIKSFNYTRSFAARIDNNPIENLGVTPDIPCELTCADLQDNYKNYVEAICKAVKQIMKK